jgi:hypothetical protein
VTLSTALALFSKIAPPPPKRLTATLSPPVAWLAENVLLMTVALP